jgi:hypothetical protein
MLTAIFTDLLRIAIEVSCSAMADTATHISGHPSIGQDFWLFNLGF